MMLGRGKQQSQSAEDARNGRYEDFGDIERCAQACRMHRPAAAEGDKREFARVAAAVARNGPQGPRHRRIGNDMRTVRRGFERHAKRDGQPVMYRRRRFVVFQRQGAADQMAGADITEHDIGVGDGRRFVSPAIAHRSGIGAGAFRPDLHATARIEHEQAAAAGADLGDIDCRHPNMIAAAGEQPPRQVDAAADVERADPVEGTVFDDRRLCRRPAHVEGQGVGMA